ncbi:baseplate J/gp47 family protein [Peptostreptococcus equinus]|uniref:Baseplate J/gp47 family protein n=1 Tax=Peptostreptococcus equinus TaxID=3003601 RepID=A0ABY7JMZ0_9FIRM|nr:baseplate J/gp47 family protein [Peptostreptococcus sp. CBA3647]WAW14741.1 baseplate J/gp47 family protein [Peptostreptococcus sp. CBA3647]
MQVRNKEEILESMISNFALDIPVYEGTITHAIFSAVALAIEREYSIKDEEEKQIFLVDGRYEFLDKRVSEFGYLRKEGEQAHGEVIFSGEIGYLIKDGLVISCNGLDFVVSEGGVIEENGEGKAIVKAIEVGAAGNIKAGSDFTCESHNFERIFNENDFINGIDIESDEDYYARFLFTQRHKGISGNVDHYDEWARSVDGVKNSKTTDLKYGPGTVEVIVAGKDNVVSEETVGRVKEYIESVRPIGASVTVKSMSNFDIDIVARIKSSTDSETIKSMYRSIGDNYLITCNKSIIFSKLYSLLATIPEVTDVISFTANGDINNILITSEQKPKIRNIKIEVV